MQTIRITLRVLHRPVESHLADIYSKYGVDYDDRVLPSIGNEVLKAVVAGFDASELITMREHVRRAPCSTASLLLVFCANGCEQVSSRVREELTKRAEHFHLVLDDISIVRCRHRCPRLFC